MELLALSTALPVACLLAAIFVPSRLANAQAKAMRRWATLAVGCQLVLALGLVVNQFATGGTVQTTTLATWSGLPSLSFGLYLDGASTLMLALVSFVGFVVCRFSTRYLDGEASQGRYYRWIGFTIGAVSLMVVAGNLLLFFLSWVMTSFGLHQLLTHYSHRPAATRAAWTKFAFSRLGDVFLIAALVLVSRNYGTFEFTALFAKASEMSASGLASPATMAIAWLLMLAAVTKSAQFPFHTWLPDTMETPTPVSALMHAGIVNAGGYLVIRMSPLVSHAPAALTALAVAGAFTACFAGIVMLTQSSVKRSLAYSTMAQMGFMMLQCGLGAFSAAMLHIIAHSLYKAYAFLSSGSVISQSIAFGGAKSTKATGWMSAAYFALASVTVASVYMLVSAVMNVNLAAKPGGVVLSMVLCLALTTWAWNVFTLGTARTTAIGLPGVGVLCSSYLASYLAIDFVLPASGASAAMVSTNPIVVAVVLLAFGLLFTLHALVRDGKPPQWLNAARVHASNGFYLDAVYRRIVASLAAP